MKTVTVAWKAVFAASMLALPLSPLLAQEIPLGEPALFLRSNDKFAANLLCITHEENTDRNIVLAPLPVSISFAALLDGTVDSKSMDELSSALNLGTGDLEIPSRMLLARFAKPKPTRPFPGKIVGGIPNFTPPLPPGKPEELWLSAAFLYRGPGYMSQYFVDRVKERFGLEFRAVGLKTTQSEILQQTWDPALPMPVVTGPHDFWITSSTHLRSGWAGNTFRSRREKLDFTVRSGKVMQADFLKSELGAYSHVQTDDFEAVALPCNQASILLVLPAPGRDIRQLEAALAKDPDLAEHLLRRGAGDIQLPPFHFSNDVDLQKSLESMGVHRIFTDLSTLNGMVPGVGAILHGVVQRTEITVDDDGIRADSGTIMAGVYGGIMGGLPKSFHMVLNRPFIFIIRDNATHALLFLGAVMNPTVS